MGNRDEPDWKGCYCICISPSAEGVSEEQPASTSAEGKELDVAVLQYQNQKLCQQLEAQKVEYFTLENKFHQLKEKQRTYNDELAVVNKSWERIVGDLESRSVCSSGITGSVSDLKSSHIVEDGASCPPEDDFLSRLLESGATGSSCDTVSPSQLEDDIKATQSRTNIILRNIFSSISCMLHANDELAAAIFSTLPRDESSRQLQKATNDLQLEIRNFHAAVGELHLKHRLLADKVQNHRDMDAKNKAEQKRLTDELANTVSDLEENNRKLRILKAQRDTMQGVPFPFPTLGNKHVGEDKMRDKQEALQDLESELKEMMNLVSSRLVEIRSLYEERIGILRKLANFQNALMNFKSISSSKSFTLLHEQLIKSKAEMDQCWGSLEKLQVENDNFFLHEKEMNLETELADIPRKVTAFSESRTAELEQRLQKLAEERVQLENKLEAASREPCREKIIAEFKALISSLPKDMRIMQSELSKYKEAASELHSMRAETQSLSSILSRKTNELEVLSGRSSCKLAEISRLQAAVQDLQESDQELQLILEMYRRESTDSWDVRESRDVECKAWAHVQSLKSSLDEYSLELRVKAANEAEATAQQRLATAEAEIADLRQKLMVSERDIHSLSEILQSKQEEAESYLSEIESIGQAYGDMLTQNQHLLQQITERDDYNIELVMECLKARQHQDALRSEMQTMDKELRHANLLKDIYNRKIAWLDDQLKIWSEQVSKLIEDGWHNSSFLENTQRRLLDVQRESQQLRGSLDEMQAKVGRSRLDVSELLIEIEKERSHKKRIEEELEVVSRKAAGLRTKTEGSAPLQKLQQEIREYRGILKCAICHDRQKEVVIAKCYHLFCSQCVQQTLKSRHRKCPTCATTFGPNDIKPIYI